MNRGDECLGLFSLLLRSFSHALAVFIQILHCVAVAASFRAYESNLLYPPNTTIYQYYTYDRRRNIDKGGQWDSLVSKAFEARGILKCKAS